MSDPALLFVKPNDLNPEDKKALRDAGVIVVEVSDPLSIKFMRAHAAIDGDELLSIACEVIGEFSGTATREAFATGICKAIVERRKAIAERSKK